MCVLMFNFRYMILTFVVLSVSCCVFCYAPNPRVPCIVTTYLAKHDSSDSYLQLKYASGMTVKVQQN